MLRILRNQQGASAVIVAAAAMVMFGFAALAVDLGNLYFNKSHIQAMVDAASLAGAQDLRTGTGPNGSVDYSKPLSIKVRDDCETYINYNANQGDRVTVTINDTLTPSPPTNSYAWTVTTPAIAMNWQEWLHNGIAGLSKMKWPDLTSIAYACWAPTRDTSNYTNRASSVTVTASRTVDYAFAPVLGLASNTTVTATSTSAIAPKSSLNAPGSTPVPIRPWGMLLSDFTDANGISIANKVNFAIYADASGKSGLYGATYTIKINGVASNYSSTFTLNNKTYKQNFIAVDLGGTGISTYLNNVQNGYTGALNINDTTTTTDLADMGTTAVNLFTSSVSPHNDIDNVNASSVFIVPVISDPANPATTGQTVTIKGFAAFQLLKKNTNTIDAELLQVTLFDAGTNTISLYGFGNWGITKPLLVR